MQRATTPRCRPQHGLRGCKSHKPAGLYPKVGQLALLLANIASSDGASKMRSAQASKSSSEA